MNVFLYSIALAFRSYLLDKHKVDCIISYDIIDKRIQMCNKYLRNFYVGVTYHVCLIDNHLVHLEGIKDFWYKNLELFSNITNMSFGPDLLCTDLYLRFTDTDILIESGNVEKYPIVDLLKVCNSHSTVIILTQVIRDVLYA